MALVLASPAWPHAALLRTVPAENAVLGRAPSQIALTYSEPVEPRFAVITVVDPRGHRLTRGSPHRSATNPRELDVPVEQLAQGWYLVFWRVISVDGHPVRGAYTFAVGPSPGTQPEFARPSLSETAATPGLVAARWITFLAFMSAIGLFVLRVVVTRPLRSAPKELTVAFGVAISVALVAVPVYVLLATAQFAFRSATSIGALVPLMRVSAFGRGYLDLELLLALFAVAAAIALALDRRAAPRRTIAELFALLGALLAAGSVLLAPGLAGHADETSPRALALALDWLHLAAGSLWIGGLIGLLVLWRSLPAVERLAGLALCVPRFSILAFGSVVVLVGSGTWASFLHLPTLSALWHTSYGQAIVVKVTLLFGAMAVASGNLFRTVPALKSANPPHAAAVLLRRLVGGETLLVAAAIAAAAALSSLPPPPKALAGLGSTVVKAGPGPVQRTLTENGLRVTLRITPNKAATSNRFSVTIARGTSPVTGATVILHFTMLDMDVGTQAFQLDESGPGTYAYEAPALGMAGHWALTFSVDPRTEPPFAFSLLDQAAG